MSFSTFSFSHVSKSTLLELIYFWWSDTDIQPYYHHAPEFMADYIEHTLYLMNLLINHTVICYGKS